MSELGLFPTIPAFDPETTYAMGLAFDQARKAIGLNDKLDGASRLLADKIIEAAAAGERDPGRLRDAAVHYFNNGA
jgi:hypothetical protein